MFRFAILVALLLVCFCVADGQSDRPDRCPTFSVTGPAGIPIPGEPMIYEASVTGPVPTGVRYKWTVHGGVIADGQGTKK